MFWVDERCVPTESAQNNYRAEELGAAAAAKAYSRHVAEFFLCGGGESDYLPAFDCALLGIGSLGRTASQFPCSPALREKVRPFVPVEAPPAFSPRERVIMTLPVINRSGLTMFLVAGKNKRNIVQTVLEAGAPDHRIPATMVNPSGECLFLLDIDGQEYT